MPVLAALVFCRLPLCYAWYIKCAAVFCLILTAKINDIPGGDSKELRMDHRAKFHLILRPQNPTQRHRRRNSIRRFWLLNFF